MGWPDVRTGIGALVALWSAVREQAPDGCLAGWEPCDVAHALGEPAERGDDVVAALESCGLAERGSDGVLVLHEWMEHNGDHIKAALKVRSLRERKRSSPVPVTLPERSGNIRQTGTGTGTSTGTGREPESEDAASAAPLHANKAETPETNGTAPPAAPTPPEGSEPEATAETRRREAGRAVVALAAGLRMPASVTGKLDVDRVAKAAATLGPPGVKTAIQLAQRWWKAGLRHEGLLDRLVAEYVARHASIGNPFAYFNGRAFEAMRLRWGGDLSEAEARELRALECRFIAEATARGP